MPFSPLPYNTPAYWNIWGHSYCQHAFGPRTQAGRIDAFVRARVPIGYGDVANFAVTGSRLSVEGISQGGWARVMNNTLQTTNSTGPSGPAVSEGGAHLFVYGINDLGFNGQTAQFNTAYQHAARAVISRARMSWLRQNNWAGAAGTGVITYGAGFINFATTGEFSTGLTTRISTATGTTPATGSTVTFTLPSDYNGETIASLWVANPGVAGSTLTITGTAVAGTVYSGATFSTSNIMPAATLNHSPVCHRIIGLTSANAGQTIIYTITATDSGAATVFDSIWGEALNPPPVIWCNTARLTATGYAIYNTTGIHDADVAVFNAVLPPLIAEFDSMVQLADIDNAIGADPVALIYDGLHPNELGAAGAADAIYDALSSCSAPTSKYGMTSNMQSPGPRYSQEMRPRRSGQWYGPETFSAVSGTAYTAVLNDLFAVPFMVTTASSRWNQWMVQLASSTVATNVWFAIYDDRALAGYPQAKYVDTTGTSSLALSTGAGAKLSSTTGGANGNLSQPVDPGLYWLVLQIATAGTSTFTTLRGPCPYMPNGTATGWPANGGFMGYKLTGQPTGPLAKTFPAGGVLTGDVPLIALLMG